MVSIIYAYGNINSKQYWLISYAKVIGFIICEVFMFDVADQNIQYSIINVNFDTKSAYKVGHKFKAVIIVPVYIYNHFAIVKKHIWCFSKLRLLHRHFCLIYISKCEVSEV